MLATIPDTMIIFFADKSNIQTGPTTKEAKKSVRCREKFPTILAGDKICQRLCQIVFWAECGLSFFDIFAVFIIFLCYHIGDKYYKCHRHKDISNNVK